MCSFRRSEIKAFVDTINENAVDIVKNVGEATYLQWHQQKVYIEGRMADAIRLAVPEGKISVDLHDYPDQIDLSSHTFELACSLDLKGVLMVHCVRVVRRSGVLHDNVVLPKSTYHLSEKSSQPKVDFENKVHEIADRAYRLTTGDPSLTSSQLITRWESLVKEDLKKTYARETFDVSLTIKHGSAGVHLIGKVKDMDEDYEITAMLIEEHTVDPAPSVTNNAEVFIGVEEEYDTKRRRIQGEVTVVASASLVENYLAFESQLPTELALDAIQTRIKKELTDQLDHLRFEVSVSYYEPAKSLNVAIIELNNSITVSLIAKRQ